MTNCASPGLHKSEMIVWCAWHEPAPSLSFNYPRQIRPGCTYYLSDCRIQQPPRRMAKFFMEHSPAWRPYCLSSFFFGVSKFRWRILLELWFRGKRNFVVRSTGLCALIYTLIFDVDNFLPANSFLATSLIIITLHPLTITRPVSSRILMD